VNFIFLVPIFIFLIESENFLKVDSFFELSTLLTIKFLLVFNKTMNFYQIFFSSIFLNLFDIYFMKKYYCISNNDSLEQETKNKNIRKLNEFIFNFKFLMIGYFTNFLWFLYISKNLRFFVFDESKIIYIILIKYPYK